MMEAERLFRAIRTLDSNQLKHFMAEHREGSYTVLDVRQPWEYEEIRIPGSRLMPLPRLGDTLRELDAAQPLIVYCARGGRSRVAAQFLAGQGFKEVYVLEGGMEGWDGLEAAGPRELNLDMVRGDETPLEMIAIAYGMEQGLLDFYGHLLERTDDPEVRRMLTTLARVEEQHKQKLREMATELGRETEGSSGLQGNLDSGIMEGGFQIDEFLAQNERFLRTVPDIIELVMMLEAQALDLYLRFAERSSIRPAREVLYQIAEEEKGHLAALGRLLDDKQPLAKPEKNG